MTTLSFVQTVSPYSRALETMNPDTQDLRNMLDSLHGKTHIHWVPGQANIPGNEFADRAAKEAAKLPETENDTTPVSYEVARAVTKSFINDEEPQHPVVKEAYIGYIRKKADSQINSRKDAAVLAQLRSGHCLGLAHYRRRMKQ